MYTNLLQSLMSSMVCCHPSWCFALANREKMSAVRKKIWTCRRCLAR